MWLCDFFYTPYIKYYHPGLYPPLAFIGLILCGSARVNIWKLCITLGWERLRAPHQKSLKRNHDSYKHTTHIGTGVLRILWLHDCFHRDPVECVVGVLGISLPVGGEIWFHGNLNWIIIIFTWWMAMNMELLRNQHESWVLSIQIKSSGGVKCMNRWFNNTISIS